MVRLNNWLLSAAGSSVAGSTVSASLSTCHSDGHYNYNQQQQQHCCGGPYNVEKWRRITAVLQTPGSAQWYCSSAQRYLSTNHRRHRCCPMYFSRNVQYVRPHTMWCLALLFASFKFRSWTVCPQNGSTSKYFASCTYRCCGWFDSVLMIRSTVILTTRRQCLWLWLLLHTRQLLFVYSVICMTDKFLQWTDVYENGF